MPGMVQATVGVGPVLEGGGKGRMESQEVHHGHGTGSTNLEGLGRSEAGGDKSGELRSFSP